MTLKTSSKFIIPVLECKFITPVVEIGVTLAASLSLSNEFQACSRPCLRNEREMEPIMAPEVYLWPLHAHVRLHTCVHYIIHMHNTHACGKQIRRIVSLLEDCLGYKVGLKGVNRNGDRDPQKRNVLEEGQLVG